MFIEQGIKKENNFGKYLLGSFLLFIASNIGQLPLFLAVVYDTNKKSIDMPVEATNFLKYFDSNLSLFLMLLSFVFAMYAFYLVITKMHHQTFLSVTTSRKQIDWRRVIFAFSVWSCFTIITTVIFYQVSPEDFVWNFKPIPFLILLIISVALIPIQTSTEEYVFRGYLMQGFGNLAKNKWFPLLMTSLIFGGMHYGNPEVAKMGDVVMVYYIGTGLFLGIMTLMDEGIELSLGFHAANNLIGALLVSSDWTVFQTHSILKDVSDPEAGLDVILPVIVVYPILLYIFSRKYQWTNWKEKLTGKIA